MYFYELVVPIQADLEWDRSPPIVNILCCQQDFLNCEINDHEQMCQNSTSM